tara:strand:+ start:415 stop:702 length:288 start_codon:yes stop_codon:yes gene_type:complete
MKEIYILIVAGYLNFQSQEMPKIPYLEVLSSHESYKSCDNKIVATHDYFLAKDIRRKSTKQRKPRFLYEKDKSKVLYYRNNGFHYYAKCEKLNFE